MIAAANLMRHNGAVIGRRRFLASGATLPGALRCLARDQDESPRLRLVYAASAATSWLLPPLAVDPPPRVVLDFQDSESGAICQLALQVRFEGEPCLLPLAVWTDDRHLYWRARESLWLPVSRGAVQWNHGRWTLAVDGRETFLAQADLGVPSTESRLPDLPQMIYRLSLAPDWPQGPLGAGPAELWRVRATQSLPSRGIPAGSVVTSGGLEGWLPKLGASEPIAASLGGGSMPHRMPQPEFVSLLDSACLEAFAFRSYRSGSLGLLPREAAAVTERELDVYRRQDEILLSGLLIVSVDLVADSAALAGRLPPPCGLAEHPLVRVLALRGLDDPSLDEAWLLIQCSLEGRQVWYAASHLRPDLDGSEFGREVLGYPTQDGHADVILGASYFTAGARRQGRTLFRASGICMGFSTGTTLDDLEVAALRLRPRSSTRPRGGELIVQPWYYQGLRRRVQPSTVDAAFPDSGTAGSALDAWTRLGAIRTYSATVTDSADMQRLPGAVVSEIEEVGPYYRDRCDGRLPWERQGAGGRQTASD